MLKSDLENTLNNTDMLNHSSATLFNRLWDENELDRCEKWIKENNFKIVCLQFPDDLLSFRYFNS